MRDDYESDTIMDKVIFLLIAPSRNRTMFFQNIRGRSDFGQICPSKQNG